MVLIVSLHSFFAQPGCTLDASRYPLRECPPQLTFPWASGTHAALVLAGWSSCRSVFRMKLCSSSSFLSPFLAVTFGLRKCHKNILKMILNFICFLWHNCNLSEFALSRGKDCDISKQTETQPCCSLYTIHSSSVEVGKAIMFSIEVEMKNLSFSQHQILVFILTRGFKCFGMIALIKHLMAGTMWHSWIQGLYCNLVYLKCIIQRNKSLRRFGFTF